MSRTPTRTDKISLDPVRASLDPDKISLDPGRASLDPGRAWVFGDDIDTDAIAPSAYLMKPLDEVKRHCLELSRPDFAPNVRAGDVFVAGRNLGIGSSRELAPQCLQALGIRCILARSFARIFYRNALNLGIPVLACADVATITDGDRLTVDVALGQVFNVTTGKALICEPLPGHLLAMVNDGGLLAHLRRKLHGQEDQSL